MTMDITQSILSDITVWNKYAKWIPETGRREDWQDLCERNMAMHIKKYPQLKDEIKKVYKEFVLTKKVLPSMRSLQFGGRPIELSNNRMFNCAFLPVDHSDAFSETMFLLLGGSGVGFSVQHRHVDQLPVVQGPKEKPRRFLVGDSIEGWADAVKVLVEAYFKGKSDPIFDYRDIRKKGARLITSGGKAPGPDPLRICIDHLRDVLEGAKGRQLKPIEAHDMMCHIADAVLSGGIRRAAMISLFDKNDDEMLTCKGQLLVDNWELEARTEGDYTSHHGFCIYKGKRVDMVLSDWDYNVLSTTQRLPWYYFEQQRGRANNSVVLVRGEVTEQEFKDIWQKVIDSKAGEPGVYWTNDPDWGTNPCVEIGLRPNQFCNLTEINASDVVDQADLNARARAGSFIGTLQAGYTDFHYLRPIWKENTEKDALIGVSMTGIGSGRVFPLDLKEAANVVKEENKRVAEIIGINPAARTTAVKPAGTTSLVVGSASGIHAWHNDYYIRRMRVGKNEALYDYMVKNIPALIEDCKFKPNIEAVMSFPQKAPEGAILRNENFMDLLERVKRFNIEWVGEGHVDGNNNHNVSCTISLKDDEWWKCAAWMWENRNHYNGISVLPYDGGTYVQAPFEDCTKEKFDEMVVHLKAIDLHQVVENDDHTAAKDQAACAGGACEVTQ
jgi:ribonucleoside-diphosphate reductase alpha chain